MMTSTQPPQHQRGGGGNPGASQHNPSGGPPSSNNNRRGQSNYHSNNHSRQQSFEAAQMQQQQQQQQQQPDAQQAAAAAALYTSMPPTNMMHQQPVFLLPQTAQTQINRSIPGGQQGVSSNDLPTLTLQPHQQLTKMSSTGGNGGYNVSQYVIHASNERPPTQVFQQYPTAVPYQMMPPPYQTQYQPHLMQASSQAQPSYNTAQPIQSYAGFVPQYVPAGQMAQAGVNGTNLQATTFQPPPTPTQQQQQPQSVITSQQTMPVSSTYSTYMPVSSSAAPPYMAQAPMQQQPYSTQQQQQQQPKNQQHLNGQLPQQQPAHGTGTLKREKKILKIEDPNSHKVINEDAILAAKEESHQNTAASTAAEAAVSLQQQTTTVVTTIASSQQPNSTATVTSSSATAPAVTPALSLTQQIQQQAAARQSSASPREQPPQQPVPQHQTSVPPPQPQQQPPVVVDVASPPPPVPNAVQAQAAMTTSTAPPVDSTTSTSSSDRQSAERTRCSVSPAASSQAGSATATEQQQQPPSPAVEQPAAPPPTPVAAQPPPPRSQQPPAAAAAKSASPQPQQQPARPASNASSASAAEPPVVNNDATVTAEITLNGPQAQNQNATHQLHTNILTAMCSKSPPVVKPASDKPQASPAAAAANDSVDSLNKSGEVTFGDVDRKQLDTDAVVTLPEPEPSAAAGKAAALKQPSGSTDRGDSEPPASGERAADNQQDMSQSMVETRVTPPDDEQQQADAAEAAAVADAKALINKLKEQQQRCPTTYNCFQDKGILTYDREMMSVLLDLVKFTAPELPPCTNEFPELDPSNAAGPRMPGGHRSIGGGGGNFNVPWAKGQAQQQQGGTPGFARGSGNFKPGAGAGPRGYTGRQSNSGPGGGGGGGPRGSRTQPQQKVFQPSLPLDVKLNKSENAWKPKKLGATTAAELNEKETLVKKVRGLLNKITPQFYNDLKKEFFDMMMIDMEVYGPDIIEIIFTKAVDEPNYCSLYSQLCKEQVDLELTRSSKASQTGGGKSLFRNHILTKCQKVFSNSDDEFKKKIESDRDAREKTWEELATKLKSAGNTAEYDKEKAACEKDVAKMNDDIQDLAVRERRRMFGNIRFIGELYKNKLLIANIINHCLRQLIQQALPLTQAIQATAGDAPSADRKSDLQNELGEVTECLIRLLSSVGKTFEQERAVNITAASRDPNVTPMSGKEMVEQCFNFLDSVIVPAVKPRIRFAIIELRELRANAWNPRRAVDGPKKIDQVRNEVRQEGLQKEIDHQLRQGRDSRGGGGGGGGGNRPQQYGGRGSHNKYDPQQQQGGRGSQGMPGMSMQQQQRQRQPDQVIAPGAQVRAGVGTLSKHTKPPFASAKPGNAAPRSWATGASGGSSTFTQPEQPAATPTGGRSQRRVMQNYAGRGSQDSTKDSRSASRETSLSRQPQQANDRMEALRSAQTIVGGQQQPQPQQQQGGQGKPVTARGSDSSVDSRMNTPSEMSGSLQPSPAPTPDPAKTGAVDREKRRKDGRSLLMDAWGTIRDCNYTKPYADKTANAEHETQLKEISAELTTESGTQTEAYEFAVAGMLEGVMDCKANERRPYMVMLAKLLVAGLRPPATRALLAPHTVQGIQQFFGVAEEVELEEDVPRMYEYVGEALAHVLLAAYEHEWPAAADGDKQQRQPMFTLQQLAAPTLATAQSHQSAKIMFHLISTLQTETGSEQGVLDMWTAWQCPVLSELLNAAKPGAWDALLAMHDGRLGWLQHKLVPPTTSSTSSTTTPSTTTTTSGASSNSHEQLSAALSGTDQVAIELERKLKELRGDSSLSDEEKANQIMDTFKRYYELKESYSCAFAQRLVTGICDMVFLPKDDDSEEPEYELNQTQFSAYNKVMMRFVTGNEECELAALEQLTHAVVYDKQYPRGAMVSMVSNWLSGQIVSSETLRKWYSSVQEPMIKSDGQLRKVLSDCEEDDDDDEDEEDEEEDEETEESSTKESTPAT